MGREPLRSSLVTWLLIGLVVVLLLGTAGAVAIPVIQCPSCRYVVTKSGEQLVRRLRVQGKWIESDQPCSRCSNRMRVTALNYTIGRYQAIARK